jgi:DUF4097 and DUF4098 domain-containing protein YvlB
MGEKTRKLIDSKEVNGNEINKIELKLYSTDVEIKEAEDDQVKIEYYSNRNEKSKIEYYNGTLRLDERDNEPCIGICNISRRVTLYIPSEFNGTFAIDTQSGDVNSRMIMNQKTNISTASGDVSLEEVNDISITTASGDVEINKVTDKLSISTVSGDVELETLEIEKNSTINTISGDVEISNNKSNCYVDFSSVSGDAKIRKSNRKSDLVLTVNTTSGDISVN